jgi:hypothetical protein
MKQGFFIGYVVVVLAIKINALDQLQMQHDAAATTCCILDFTTILRLAIYCNILWEAMVDPMASLPIPVLTHRLTYTYSVHRRKVRRSMLNPESHPVA